MAARITWTLSRLNNTMNESNENPYRPPSGSDSADRSSEHEPERKGMTGKLIVLSTFDNSVDAHFFKNELENNGIQAAVNNESTTATFGATIAGASSAFWIEVVIMESDAERGLKIKNQWNSDSVDENTEEIPEWSCKCGETVDEGFAVCWNCGSEIET